MQKLHNEWKERQQRFQKFWRSFTHDRTTRISLVIIAIVTLLAVTAPWLPIPDPMAFTQNQYSPPGTPGHLLGTDNFARDMLSRVIWGGRVGLTVAVVSAGISITIGILIGSLAGFFGGWIDDVLSRVIDIFLMIPAFFLALLIVALFGPSILLIMVVIGVTTWPRPARIMRSQVLTLKSRTYVQAARTAGASSSQLLAFHIIPNGIPPVITNATLLMGSAIIVEAGLSFLGLGDPSVVSWGRMISAGQSHLRLAPWMSIFPGIAMLLVVCAFNLIGDGLNYVINPHSRERKIDPGLENPLIKPNQIAKPNKENDSTQTPNSFFEISDLTMYYALQRNWVRAVDNVSLKMQKGSSLGLVGESGCGKTSIGLSLIRVLPANARIFDGNVFLDGKEILNVPDREFQRVRWNQMSMIFQSAMNALNPVAPVGKQLIDAYQLHRPRASKKEGRLRVEELFDLVNIPQSRMRSYPHELSGGMRQRVMIALALLLEPDLIIADEPTTALDVLIQDQILYELDLLKEKMNLSLVLITHDASVVAESCDRTAVMYAGQIVEEGPSMVLFEDGRHPYTRGLLGSLPSLTGPKHELVTIPGESFTPVGEVLGCRFTARCPLATDLCRHVDPPEIMVTDDHWSRCHYALEDIIESAWAGGR